jgi:hypothetical protein
MGFVLGANGNPATLQVVDTTADAAEAIEPNVDQSLLIRPGRKTVSFGPAGLTKITRPPAGPDGN